MNRCCEDAVKNAARWEIDEGEVECQWCGHYTPVETVRSALLNEPWPAPSPGTVKVLVNGQVKGTGLIDEPRTLLNGGSGWPADDLWAQGPSGQGRSQPKWKPRGSTLPVPIGLGPEPPRHPSPAREDFRNWLLYNVFEGPDTEIEGSASLISDMISYALEKREQDRVWKGNELLVDINNLLDLLAGQRPEEWDSVDITDISVPGPYTGVGWHTAIGLVSVVALTGQQGDEASDNLAQFFAAMPELLLKLKAFLSRPL